MQQSANPSEPGFLWSKDYVFDNAYRRSLHPRLRKLFDFIFGCPIGFRTLDNTNDSVNRRQQTAQLLKASGLSVDDGIFVMGYLPSEMFELRGESLDPTQFTPYPDMVVKGPRPFSIWPTQHSLDYEEERTKDAKGPGTLYPPLPDDKYDIGAQFQQSVAATTTQDVHVAPELGNLQGDSQVVVTDPSVTVVQTFQKVIVRRPYGHLEVLWERES